MKQILVVSVSLASLFHVLNRPEYKTHEQLESDHMMTSSNSPDHVTPHGLNVSTLIHFVCIPAASRSTLTSSSLFDFWFCLFIYLFSLLKVGVNRKQTRNKRQRPMVPLGGLLRPLGEANYWNKWWPTESQVIVLKLTRAETRHREDELEEGSGNKPVISK